MSLNDILEMIPLCVVDMMSQPLKALRDLLHTQRLLYYGKATLRCISNKDIRWHYMCIRVSLCIYSAVHYMLKRVFRTTFNYNARIFFLKLMDKEFLKLPN